MDFMGPGNGGKVRMGDVLRQRIGIQLFLESAAEILVAKPPKAEGWQHAGHPHHKYHGVLSFDESDAV